MAVNPEHLFRERAFLAAGRASRHIPHFRGKTRILLVLYKLLGLSHHHIRTRTELDQPIAYAAELDLHSWLQRIAFLTGSYEADTVQFLLDLHASSGGRGYLLDIGANIGLISIPFARSMNGTSLAAVAIEAVPDNVSALERNVALNALGKVVRVIPAAAGEVAGTVEIQVEGYLQAGQGSGTANILAAQSDSPGARQTITVCTFDELAAESLLPAGCSIVKIDTDGYDLKALQGASGFLQRDRPIIFGEFSAFCMQWHQQSVTDVAHFAAERGYEIWQRLTPTSWTFAPFRPSDSHAFAQDLLLVPTEKTESVRRFRG